MDLTIRTETFGNEDQTWLGSAHGTSAARSITLDLAEFDESTHFPNGYLPSGLPLADAGDGTFVPYVEADSEANPPVTGNDLAGFLFTTIPVRSGATKVVGALLEHGVVIEANLPIAIDDDAKDDVAGRIIFR